MKKVNLNNFVHSVKIGFKKNSPGILIGIGITGMTSAIVMSVAATSKALKLIEEAKKEKEVDKLTPMDTVKTTWKCYIPTVVTASLSAACIIGSSSEQTKRNAALATAYTISENAFKEYKEKVVETIGEKKEKEVRDSIAKDEIKRDPVVNREVIITGSGTTLCYDSISKRYFQSSMEKLQRAQNELNRRMISDMYLSLNDFYYEIGLEGTDFGEDLGWYVNKGFIDLNFSSQIADNGEPCLVVGHYEPPTYDYMKY